MNASAQRRFLAGLLFVSLCLVRAVPAWALYERVYSLSEIMTSADAVCAARVQAIDPARPRILLQITENLKGASPYRQLDVDMSTGGFGHTPQAMRRLAMELPVVLFTVARADRHMALVYTNGTWLQATAVGSTDPERLDWHFTHCEKFLRTSFHGPTAALVETVRAVLAGRQKPPPPDPHASYGFGPEAAGAAAPSPPLPGSEGPALVALGLHRSAPPGFEERERVTQLARSSGFPEADLLSLAAQADYSILEPAVQLARDFGDTPLRALTTYAAAGNWEDTRQALRLVRDYGRGGDRDLVRTPVEILALYRNHSGLTWDDVQHGLDRSRHWFTPLRDRVAAILDLRLGRSWDEVDWLLNEEESSGVPLDDLCRLRADMTRDQVERLAAIHRNRQAPVALVAAWWKLSGSWTDISTALDLAGEFRGGKQEAVKDLLLMRRSRDWVAIRRQLQRERKAPPTQPQPSAKR